VKEVIILDAGGFDPDPYIHASMYENEFDYVDGETLYDDSRANHYMVILFTKNNFHGKVRMTLESMEDEEE